MFVGDRLGVYERWNDSRDSARSQYKIVQCSLEGGGVNDQNQSEGTVKRVVGGECGCGVFAPPRLVMRQYVTWESLIMKEGTSDSKIG